MIIHKYSCPYIGVYIYIYTLIYMYVDIRIHPVSITRFPLTRFSPGSGLLSNPFSL